MLKYIVDVRTRGMAEDGHVYRLAVQREWAMSNQPTDNPHGTNPRVFYFTLPYLLHLLAVDSPYRERWQVVLMRSTVSLGLCLP